MIGKAKIIRFFLLLFTIGLVLFPYQASAVGIGAAPSELDFSIRPGGSATKTLCVVNTGDSEAHYRVYVDEQYKDWCDITPEEFPLAPQANKKAQIIVSSPPFAFGSHTTCVYVVTTNSSPQVGVGSGIKIPVHIHISNLLLWIGIGVVAALLAALIIFLIRRRRIVSSETK